MAGKKVPPKSSTLEWLAWFNMRQRCRNPNHLAYKHYGGRGITICARWNSSDAFIADMGPRPTTEHTLERVDNDGPYSPENCVWATRQQQSTNRRMSAFFEFKGERLTISQASRKFDMNKGTLKDRLRHSGLTPDEAVDRPLKVLNRRYNFFGEWLTITEASRRYRIYKDTLKHRLSQGKSPNLAVTWPRYAKVFPSRNEIP